MSENIKKTSLGITGMTCAACSNKVEKNLNKLDEVNANVNPSTEKATIEYNPNVTSLEDIANTIQKTGYGVLTEKVDLDVMGMTCAACSNKIEKVLNRISGVNKATVNLTTESATVEYNPDMTSVDEFQQRIKNLGYEAQPKKEASEKSSQKEKQLKRQLIKLVVSAVLAAPLLMTMFVHLFGIQIPHIFMNPWFQFVLATPVQFVIGWQFYVGAYKNLRNGSANMDVLVALGTSAAFFY
ncbi:heavy metal translocating P-type ATPase, partial [Staphylococcus epidermidis]